MNDINIANAIELYSMGKSQEYIGKILGVSQATIYKTLLKNNISCHNRKHRKHTFNEEYFNTWSHDMAYILGFITADGSVDKYTLTINLSRKDKDILSFIMNQIGEVKLEDKSKYKSIRIRFNSVKLINSLIKYGIVPNKTSNIKVSFNIPSDYIGDYVRGVFDGDGWVSHRKNGNGLSFGICSASKEFIDDIQKLCNNIGSIRTRSYKDDQNRNAQFYFENYTNEDAVKFRELIYSSGGFSLKRKKDKFFSRLNQS